MTTEEIEDSVAQMTALGHQAIDIGRRLREQAESAALLVRIGELEEERDEARRERAIALDAYRRARERADAAEAERDEARRERDETQSSLHTARSQLRASLRNRCAKIDPTRDELVRVTLAWVAGTIDRGLSEAVKAYRAAHPEAVDD